MGGCGGRFEVGIDKNENHKQSGNKLANFRVLAANRNIVLDVYSGTHGVTQLKDISGNWQEIFFYVNGATRQIPVPKIYYKILINKADNSGKRRFQLHRKL